MKMQRPSDVMGLQRSLALAAAVSVALMGTASADQATLTGSEPASLDPKILALVGDKDYGAYLSAECTTCHQADGSYEGMPSITGWDTEIFVIVMHAYKTKERKNQVMQMIAGRLSNEEIAALAAFFEGVEQ